ncbi:MAG: hypothetical protein V1660_03795 [archaeon]
MEFVSLLSTGQGSWAQVSGLIRDGEWDKIILVGEAYAQKFSSEKEIEFVQVDFNQPINSLKDELVSKLKEKIKGIDVALSIASGTGKEHMALISALLAIPVGVRFFVLTKEGVVEL